MTLSFCKYSRIVANMSRTCVITLHETFHVEHYCDGLGRILMTAQLALIVE